MLLKSLIDGYLLDCKARNLSPSTLRAYKPVLLELCEYLDNPQADSITAMDLRRYIAYTSERGKYTVGNHPLKEATDEKLSVYSVHKQVRTLKAFFRWATDEGVLETDPSARIKRPKLPQGRIDTFTQEQIDILLRESKGISYRNYAICFLLLDSGLRKSELIQLALDDVNILTGLITVQHGKGNKARQVKVGDHCRKILWLYVNEYRNPNDENESTFFVSRYGEPLTGDAVSSIMRRLSQKCGFRVHAHKFRHTYATNLARKFPNAFLIAQVLGHSDLETSKGYIHLAASDVQNVLSPMDDMLNNK